MLRAADVRLLLDVRQRRGVRGPEYAWANSQRLVVSELPSDGAAALLCVERDPEACHRSLIAERIATEHGMTTEHLRPS